MKTEIGKMRPYLFDELGIQEEYFVLNFYQMIQRQSILEDRKKPFNYTRSCKITNSIYGPEKCEDSIDLNGNILVIKELIGLPINNYFYQIFYN